MSFRIYLLFLAIFNVMQPQCCQLSAIAERQKRWVPALIFPPTSPTRVQVSRAGDAENRGEARQL